MAGYDYHAGMSNNAVDAYERGLLPASKIKPVPAKLIREYVRAAEWHHTSKWYNATDMFDPDEVLAVFGIKESEDYAPNPRAIEALKEWKEKRSKEKKTGGKTYKNCRVRWLEWYGSKRHPYASEKEATGCTVVVKGQTATILLPNDRKIIKRLFTNGFSFEPEGKPRDKGEHRIWDRLGR